MTTQVNAPEPADLEEEANRIVALFAENKHQLIGFLSGQLQVVKNQAQMLMGLCGLTITVTGFSGHHMVRGGVLSATSMVLGIVLILCAIVVTLRTLRKLRWVSQDLADDLRVTARRVIARRNREQKQLALAGVLVALGLFGYLAAVVLAALANGGLLP